MRSDVTSPAIRLQSTSPTLKRSSTKSVEGVQDDVSAQAVHASHDADEHHVVPRGIVALVHP